MAHAFLEFLPTHLQLAHNLNACHVTSTVDTGWTWIKNSYTEIYAKMSSGIL